MGGREDANAYFRNQSEHLLLKVEGYFGRDQRKRHLCFEHCLTDHSFLVKGDGQIHELVAGARQHLPSQDRRQHGPQGYCGAEATERVRVLFLDGSEQRRYRQPDREDIAPCERHVGSCMCINEVSRASPKPSVFAMLQPKKVQRCIKGYERLLPGCEGRSHRRQVIVFYADADHAEEQVERKSAHFRVIYWDGDRMGEERGWHCCAKSRRTGA